MTSGAGSELDNRNVSYTVGVLRDYKLDLIIPGPAIRRASAPRVSVSNTVALAHLRLLNTQPPIRAHAQGQDKRIRKPSSAAREL